MTARKAQTNQGYRRRPTPTEKRKSRTEPTPEELQAICPWERLSAFGAQLRAIDADLDEFGRYVEAPRALMVGISFALALAIRHIDEIEREHAQG